jgi:hypothetical protein
MPKSIRKGPFVEERRPKKAEKRARSVLKAADTKLPSKGRKGWIVTAEVLGQPFITRAAPKGESGFTFRALSSTTADRTTAPTPERLAAVADYHRARIGFSSDSGLAEVLGVHRSALGAWKRGDATPSLENARLLSHLAVTVGELAAFLDPDVIPDWLVTEQFGLGGQTPAEALRERRLAEVLFAANATEHGAYI